MKYQTLQNALKLAACLSAFLMTTAVFSNPVLNNVAAGHVTVTQTPNTTTVNQTSGRAILNWNSFNIGAQQHTHFQQPAGGMALNRISPTQGASAIYGRLTATGRIILVNPAGIFFGPNSYVNVGGLIATTANITDENFLKGNYQFDQVPGYRGSIINTGKIIAAQHGLVALVGNNVENHGLIEADVGQIVLASGNAFTLSFSGDNLVSFAVTEGSSGSVTNTGALQAAGGKVLVTARAAQGVLDNVINMGGVVEAKSVGVRNGEIILSGDPNFGSVKVTGKVRATGRGQGEKGGTIAITGKKILVDKGATIDASGKRGGGKIYVGGNYQGKGPLANAKRTKVDKSAMLLADATSFGDGGEIIVWSDDYSAVGGHLSAQGGSEGGNGGLIETSSHGVLAVDKDLKVSTNAPMGTKGRWLLDPSDLTISNISPDSGVNVSGGFIDANTGATNSNLYIGTLINALADNNVIVKTDFTPDPGGAGEGNITVATPITWYTPQSLTLFAKNKIFINSDIKAPLGSLILEANNISQSITSGTTGSPSATGVTANINVRNFNLVKGQWYQSNATLPQFNVTNNFQIDSGVMPTANAQFTRRTGGAGILGNPYTIADIYGLQGIGANSTTLGAYYQLANDIEASGTRYWNSQQGFVPIGHPSTFRFTGNFDGNNKSINNLYINRILDTRDIGLIGAAQSANIHDVVINNARIFGTNSPQSNGILVGYGASITATNNKVLNSSITAATGQIGGMYGNVSGTISSSFADNVTIKGGGSFNIGGLIGTATAIINDSYSSGSITLTGGFPNAGGLAGTLLPGSTVDNSYSTASITNAGATFGMIGGLVGINYANLTNTYATGAISNSAGGVQLGGLVASNFAAITNSFWDSETTGLSYSADSIGFTGYKGMTTAEMKDTTNFTNPANGFVTSTWSISNLVSTGSTPASTSWLNFSGETRPMLKAEWNTTIRTPHQMQLAGMALDANYTLGNNIDLTSLKTVADVWGSGPSGTGYLPVGTFAAPFTGNFSGNYNVITNLYINRPSSTNYIGLFGNVDTSNITNVGVSGNITTGGNNVGMLAGRTNASTLTNVYSTGNISAVNTVGGLVGVNNNSTINQSYSSVNVSGSSSSLGGLVGSNSNIGNINDSYATGSVIGAFASASIGGFVGNSFNSSNIRRSYSTGHSSGAGFIGSFSNGTFTSNYWDTESSGNATSSGGGTGLTTAQMKQSGNFSGWSIGTDHTVNTWVIFNGYTRPMLAAEVNPLVNGSRPINNAHQLQLVGLNGTTRAATWNLNSNIDASGTSSTTDVWGTTVGSAPAGFVPIGDNVNTFSGTFDGNNKTISNLYIYRPTTDGLGDLIGTFGVTTGATIKNINIDQLALSGSQYIGGLVGYAQNNTNIANVSITNSTINDNSATPTTAGGLVGYLLSSVVSNSSTSGTITGLGDQTGGLIGWNDSGSIIDSKNSMTVTGVGNYTGGLVGFNGGSIYRSFNTGKVIGGNITGGLAGSNALLIMDSYSTGNVSGTSNVGGLVGYNTSGIYGTYSIGAVSGTSNVGGLVGLDGGGDVGASYWDTATSGRTTSAGGTPGCFTGVGCPAGTANLSSSSTFIPQDWDFTNVWGIVEDQSYPYLLSAYPFTPRAITVTSSAPVNSTVNLVAQGTKIDNVLTFANGTAYFLVANDAITDGDYLLAYLKDATFKANTIAVAPNAGGSISDLSFVGHIVQAGQDDTSSTLSNANLGSALGTYTDAGNILYSVSGNELTINPTYAFSTTSPTQYNLEGNINTTSQDVIFGGPVNLADLVLAINAGSGNVMFGSTVDGLSAFTVNSTGLTQFSGAVGSLSPLISLTTDAGGTTLFTGGSVTTSNDQTYNDQVFTDGDMTFTSQAGNLDFKSTIDMDTFAAAAYDLNFYAENGSITFGGKIGSQNMWVPNNITVLADAIYMNAIGGVSWSPTIFSLGNQTYTGPVYLSEDTVLNGLLGSVNFISDATHLSTIDSMGATPRSLAVYFGSDNYFSENVGANNILASLASIPNQVTFSTYFENTLFPNKTIEVHTVGNQTYGDDVHINNPVSLISTAGDIFFQQTQVDVGVFVGGNIKGSNALTISNAGLDSFVEKSLENIGSFTKDGIGILTLFGNNTYSGTINIQRGILGLAVGATFDPNVKIQLSDVNSTALNLNSNVQTLAGISGGGLNGGDIYNGGKLTINQSGSATFGGRIIGTGDFVKTGSGALTLTNQYSDYTGSTDIQNGSLIVSTLSDFGFNSSIGNGTDGIDVLISGSGKLIYSGSGSDFSNRSFSIGLGGGTISATNSNLTLTGNLNLNNNEVIFDTTGSGNINYAGLISDLGPSDYGNVTKKGTGTLRLSNTDNTYYGATTIQNGTVEVTKLADYDNTSSLGASQAGFIQIGTGTTSGTLSYIGTSDVSTNRGIDLQGNSTLRSTNNKWTQNQSIFLNGYDLTFDTVGGNIEVAGNISGSGSITKTGIDILKLSAGNTYNGSTTINEGTLQLGVNNGITTTSPLQIASGATFDLNGFDQTLSDISGQGTIINNNYSNLSTFTLNNSPNLVFDGTLSGYLNFTKTGGNTLTLNSTNTYEGVTTISAGTVIAGADNALGMTHLVLNGNLDLNNHDQHSLDFEGSGTITNSGPDFKTFTVESFGETIFDGGITGNLNLYKTGSGKLTLQGSGKTYTGTTTLNGGTLLLDAGANTLPTGTRLIFVSSSQAPVLDLNGTNQTVASLNGDGGQISNGNLANFSTLTINNSVANPSSFDGIINGDINLSKSGAGTLTLSGNNQYTGSTTISAGRLITANADVLPDATAVNLTGSTSVLELGGSETIGSLSGTQFFSQVILNGALTTGGNNSSTTFGGFLTGFGNLVKEGTGNFTLGRINNYIGDTVINDGTLSAGASNVITDGSTVILNGPSAVFDLAGFSDTIGALSSTYSDSIVNLGSGSLAVGNNTLSTTFDGIITGTGSLTKVGIGTLTLGGSFTNDFSGGVSVNSGTLAINKDSALGTGTVTLNGGTLNSLISLTLANNIVLSNSSAITGANPLNLNGTVVLNNGTLSMGNSDTTTINNEISGAGILRQTNGLLVLANSNSYTGGTILDGGIIQLNVATDGLGSGELTLNNGSLRSNLAATLNNDFTVNGTVDITGTNDLNLSGAGTLNSDLTISNTAITTLGGVISGAGGFIKNNTGTFVLAGNNTYSGKTIVNGGVLSISSENNLGVPSSFAADQLTLNGGTLFATNSLTMDNADRGISLGSGGGSFRVGAGNTLIIGNNISGLGGLTKIDTGILSLDGANTYQGNTTINAGTLIANNNSALGNGDVDVASGSTLQINNGITIGNQLNINGDGALGSNGALVGSGSATVTGPIFLVTDSTIGTNLSGDALVINGTINDVVDSTHTLTLNGSGMIYIRNQVGDTARLAAITANSNVTLGNNGIIDIVTSGDQKYNSPVTLAGNVSLFTNNGAIDMGTVDTNGPIYDLSLDTSSGPITLGTVGGINRLGVLTLNTSGLTTLGGAVTASSIITDAGGSTHIDGGTITTFGNQNFNDDVLLGATTTLDSNDHAIKFAERLDGNHDLTINAGTGDVEFVKDVGVQVAALNQLIINSTGTTTFGGEVEAANLTTNTGGITNINGGAITTNGVQTFNDMVFLGDNTTLVSNGGAVKFSELLNGGGFDLTLNAGAGAVDFVKAVSNLDQLAVNSTGITTFTGTVNAGSLITNAGGSTHIDGGAITTNGVQTFNDDVVLGDTTTLASNGGAIEFVELLNGGGFDLTLNAGAGAVDFDKAISGLNQLAVNSTGTTTFTGTVNAANLTTNAGGSTHIDGGAITTTGAQTFNDNVVLGAITTLDSNGGAIKFSELLNGGGFNLTLDADGGAVNFDKAVSGINQLAVNSTGITTFGGTLNAGSLITNAGGSTHIDGGAITTSGVQTFNDNVVLGDNTTLVSNGGAVDFAELLNGGGFDLTINATGGAISFDKAVSGIDQLAVNSTGTTTFTGTVNAGSLITNAGGSTHIDGGAITTTGAQTFNDNVVLGAITTLASNGGAVKFSELLNGGGFNLTLNAGAGAVNFDKAVSGIGQLAVNSTGTTTFTDTVNAGSLITNAGGSTHIDGGAITTNGVQTFNDNVVLGAITTLASNGGAIKFSELLNGGGFDLTLNAGAGAINFDKAVSGIDQLAVNSTGTTTFTGTVNAANLTTNAGGSTHIDGGAITTNGVQTFNDNVVLGADTILASNGGAVDFVELFNGGGFDLTLNAGAGAINFDKAVSGIDQLAVNSTGTTTFTDTVNAGSLITNAGGSTHIDGGAITTSGVQTFNDNVVLGAITTLASNGGAVKFSELLNGGGFNLTLNAGAGAVNFDKAVSGIGQLAVNSTGTTTFTDTVNAGSLITNAGGSTHIDGGAITTNGVQTFNDNVVLGAITTLASNGGAIKFSELLNGGGFDLTLNAGASTVDFDKAVSGIDQLAVNSTGTTTFTGTVNAGSLITNAGGSTHIDGGAITTNGVQTFNDNVVLGAITTLASNGGAVKFSELLNGGGFNLTLNAGAGAVNFDKAVSGIGQLAVNSTGTTTFTDTVNAGSLITNAGGSTHIDGGAITTNGVQTFNDDVVLGNNTTLISNGGAVKFSELLNGSFDLAIDAGAGAVNFEKAVGNNNALTQLTSTGSGAVTFNGVVGSTGSRIGSIDITGNTNINGGAIYTSGSQAYGNIALGNNTLLDTGNSNTADLLLAPISGNGFNLVLNSAGNTSIGGAISGISSLTTNAGGTTTVGANVTSTGLQTYNDAVLLTGNRTFTSSANDIIMQGTLDGGGFAVSFNNNGTNSAINGVISNLSSFTKAGTGTLALTAANNQSGNTNVNAGRLNISNTQALGTSEAVVTNATLGIMGSLGPITNAMVFNNGQLVSSATNTLNGALFLTGNNIVNATNNLNVNGLVSGPGGVNINGTGSVIFGNSNNYTGATTLTSGQLIANNAVNPFGLGTLNLNGGTLSAMQTTTLGNSDFVVNNSVNVGGSKAITMTGTGQINGQLNQNNTASTKLSGSIVGTGTLAQNVGTLVLDADNTGFNGELAFNGGTFSISNSNGLGDASLAINNGLVFDLTNVSFDNNLILNNGTLSITGNSTLLSDLILGAGSNNTILINDGASFSMNHDIKGAGSLVIAKGAGSNPTNMILNGNISNVTDITSNVDMTINASSIQSTGNQRYNNPIVLAANTAFTSTQGAIRFVNTINGNQNLNVQSQGAVTFDKAIGATTALNSLTARGSAININGGSVKTVGDQNYQGAVTVNKTTRFETTGTNDTTIAFNNGLQGNQVITLAGGLSSNETFMIKGSLSAQKISVEGGNAGANNLQVDTGTNQTFTVAANSQGSATLQGVAQFVFKNIQSLTGGTANDNFIIQNGNMNALNGAGGNNTITGKPGSNEVWNISGTNSGQSTVINQFNNIQNLIGGNGDDTFILAGRLTGNITGSNGNDQLATVDGVNSWTLNSLNGGNVATLSGGVWQNKLGGGFTNIEALQGGSGNDTFTLAGGTASKGISGGSGNDALVANTSATNNNWSITTANAGQWQGVPGSQQTFADVENLTGNNNNTFKFSDGATLAGTVDGGSLNTKNVIDVTAYKSPLTVKLATTNSGVIYDANNQVTAFNNITDLNNTNQSNNTIYLPAGKGGTVWVDGINSGYINDPINFTGYQTIFGSGSSSADFSSNNQVHLNSVNGNLTTVQVNGMPMYFYDFGNVNASFPIVINPTTPVVPNVASIIQQPPTNADSSAPLSMEPEYVLMSQTLTQNMNNLLDQVAKQYDTDLKGIKINPYCYAAN